MPTSSPVHRAQMGKGVPSRKWKERSGRQWHPKRIGSHRQSQRRSLIGIHRCADAQNRRRNVHQYIGDHAHQGADARRLGSPGLGILPIPGTRSILQWEYSSPEAPTGSRRCPLPVEDYSVLRSEVCRISGRPPHSHRSMHHIFCNKPSFFPPRHSLPRSPPRCPKAAWRPPPEGTKHLDCIGPRTCCQG